MDMCFPRHHLSFVVFKQPFGSRPAGVIRHIQNYHTLLLPANKRAIRHTLHHSKEVLVAMMTSGDYRKGGPVVLFKHLKDNLKLEQGGASELEVDGAALLKANTEKAGDHEYI